MLNVLLTGNIEKEIDASIYAPTGEFMEFFKGDAKVGQYRLTAIIGIQEITEIGEIRF